MINILMMRGQVRILFIIDHLSLNFTKTTLRLWLPNESKEVNSYTLMIALGRIYDALNCPKGNK
jgi:hypothetical protein